MVGWCRGWWVTGWKAKVGWGERGGESHMVKIRVVGGGGSGGIVCKWGGGLL